MKFTQLLLLLLINACLWGQNTALNTILQQAETYLSNGEYEQSLFSLKQIKDRETTLTPQMRVQYSLIEGEAYEKTYKLNLSLKSIKDGLGVYDAKLVKIDTNYLWLLLKRGLLEDDLGASEKSKQTLEEVLDQSNILPLGHEIQPLTYSALAGTIRSFGEYHQAIEYYKKAKSLFITKHKTEYHHNVAMIYNNMGNCYKDLFQEEKAEQNYKRAWELYGEINNPDNYYKAGIAYNMAVFFIRIEDIDNALLYANYGLEIAKQKLKGTPLHAYMLNLLGQVYRHLGDFEKAQYSVDLAKPIYDKYQADYLIPTYNYYASRGAIYSYQELHEKALIEFHHAASLLEPVKEENPLNLANCYGLLGPEYTNIGEFDKAQQYLQKAIDLSIPLIGEKDPEVIFYYTDIAYNYIESGQLEKALKITNIAIENIGFNSSSTSPYEEVSELSTLLRSFTDKEDILFKLYQKTGDLNQLEAAKKQAVLNLNTLNYLRHNYNNPLAIITVNVQYEELFELSLNIYYEAYQINPSEENSQLFLNTLEASKSYALLEQLLVAKVKKYAKIPVTTLDNERDLKSKLAFWESELPYMETDEEIENVQRQIVTIKSSLDSLITIMKRQYPDYTSFKYYTNPPKIAGIQSRMGQNKGTIEYFVGKEAVYIIKITKAQISIFKLRKDAELEQGVGALTMSIKKPFMSTISSKEFDYYKLEYEKWAYLLYQKLIEPLGILPAKLTIIPDGFLWNLPFDCLLSEQSQADFNKKPYFAKKCKIDYQYSLILQEVLESMEVSSTGWVGIAPSFSGNLIASTRLELAPLVYNEKEVGNILNITNGVIYEGLAATKSQFLNTLGRYAFYHLATHAVITQGNDENPYLAFYPDSISWKLNVQDIYKLTMPSEMVVLSACNSGQGKLERGEGMASLSRAFFYAGAKSIIMTQWQVNDQATAMIMELFYAELKKGVPKNIALNTAKNTYLASQKNHNLAHPFYWAGFTPIGSMEMVRFDEESSRLGWLLAGGVLLLLAVVVGRKF